MNPNFSHPTGAWDLRPYAPETIQEHLSHREENIFVKDCEDCEAEYCVKCSGTWYLPEGDNCSCQQGRLW